MFYVLATERLQLDDSIAYALREASARGLQFTLVQNGHSALLLCEEQKERLVWHGPRKLALEGRGGPPRAAAAAAHKPHL